MRNEQEITNTAKITAIWQQRKVTLNVRRTKLGLYKTQYIILTVHTVSIHHAVAAIITPALRPPTTRVNTSQHLTQLAVWLPRSDTPWPSIETWWSKSNRRTRRHRAVRVTSVAAEEDARSWRRRHLPVEERHARSFHA